MWTGQVALENGWTFIQARPGVDDLSTVLQTAKLYQPAVVFFASSSTFTSSNESSR